MDFLSILGIGLLIIVALLFLFGLVFLKISVFHDTIGRKEETFRPKLREDYPDVLPWFDDRLAAGQISEEFITNKDGLRLHAYLYPAQNAKANVILVHGYSGCALQTLPHARMYHDQMQCNVVMVDLAHHAKSEGKVTGMGWKDRMDLLLWIDWTQRYFSQTDAELPMVLHGLSMGGSCVLMTAGEGLPRYVKALVDDSGYSSAFAEFSHEITTKLHLPVFPFAYAASATAKLFLDWSFREASALKRMSTIQQPVMIIHGDADKRVVYSEGKRLFDAKTTGYRELWTVKDGTHIYALKMYPEEYSKRIRTFMEQWVF